MPDKKPTDSEIVKALECCREFSDCDGCQYGYLRTRNGLCIYAMQKDALDLINRLQAENERLYGDNMTYKLRWARATARLDTAKAEAYKEFAERLKMRAINRYNEFEDYQEYPYATIAHIDELLKDMVNNEN